MKCIQQLNLTSSWYAVIGIALYCIKDLMNMLEVGVYQKWWTVLRYLHLGDLSIAWVEIEKNSSQYSACQCRYDLEQ